MSAYGRKQPLVNSQFAGCCMETELAERGRRHLAPTAVQVGTLLSWSRAEMGTKWALNRKEQLKERLNLA